MPTPSLNVFTKQIHAVDYNDFDTFVQEVYGRPEFESAADLESANDTSHEFGCISKKPWGTETMDKWDQPKFETWKATGKGSFMTRLILRDLVNNGLAPEGEYLIRVSW